MIRAANYWQCHDMRYWVSQGFEWADVVADLSEQAEAIEIAVARGIYRKTANPDNPDYSLWWIAIKSIYSARENARIVVEKENYRDWPEWVDLRRKLWTLCNGDGWGWVRPQDCEGADSHLWDQALERVCNKLMGGSFAYEQETSEGIRFYQAGLL